MLKLLVRDLDICRVSKVLGKNKLKASITNSTIIIYSDEITDEVTQNLFDSATIICAQNYHTSNDDTSIETEPKEQEKDTFEEALIQVPEEAELVGETETCEEVTNTKHSNIIPTYSNTYYKQANTELSENSMMDTEYYQNDDTSLSAKEDIEGQSFKTSYNKITVPEMVYRGDVYRWGNNRPYEEKEGTIKECVIIIQNDYLMSASDDTIALFCTSEYNKRAPFHFQFRLTEETMVDHNFNRLQLFDNCTLFVGHIKGISRKQLGNYLGTMTYSFMNNLQPTIDFCLGLKRSRTVNWVQLQILSRVSASDLIAISESKISKYEKVSKILKLFNFDMTKNGMKYVYKAILVANTLGDYRLEELAQTVAQKEKIDAEEVLRLIIARIRENFGFRNSPAISFIRLIDKVLKKG